MTDKGRIPNVMAGKIKFLISRNVPRPKSSTAYKLPVILRVVYSCKTKPKNHAIKIAEKKEGTDMPSAEINKTNLSIFYQHLKLHRNALYLSQEA